ncbi:T9SS type A sorting domain-containing protein, partial [Candidatus Fermentibacterales bacterium]|nr:T9SS type A sorting domain-containing protein [Candidatus Fermentibacterales bacterium]
QNYSGYPFVDGATMIDSMETGLMPGWDITHMSEHWGIVPSPFPWPPISESAFSGAWRTGEHGVVNWSGHGWPDGAYRTVWAWDDGDGVPESGNGELQSYSFIHVSTTSLEDDHPSVLFAVSCDVGYPEPNQYGNCGLDLLTEPGWGSCVAVLSASRPAAVSGDWKSDGGGTEQICYDFNRYLIVERARVGEALHQGKYDATTNYGWPLVYEYMNLYNYNLYGDPSLELEGVSTGIEGGQPCPGAAPALSLPCPNPFAQATSLVLSLSTEAVVQASVLDLSGRLVASMSPGSCPAGETALCWDGRTDDGLPLDRGMYFVVVTAGDQRLIRKLVLLR